MTPTTLFALVVLIPGSEAPPFPLRTDAPPKEWKAEELNGGLPYRWEKGTVHLLAWEVTEDEGDGRRSRLTQALVLKRFDQPTEKGGYRWVLAHLYHWPEDKDRPWHKEMLHIPPLRPGERMPALTGAEVFGHEFYKEVPTDKQMETFLRGTRWRPSLGPYTAFTLRGGEVVRLEFTTKLAAGGVDRTLWKKVLSQDVPTSLFTELKRATEAKK